MNDLIRQDIRAIIIRSSAILGLTVCGSLIGLALALVAAQALGQFCAEDSACQSGLYAFLGGVALTQGSNLIVIFALCRRLRRRRKSALRMTWPEVFAINDDEGHSRKRCDT